MREAEGKRKQLEAEHQKALKQLRERQEEVKRLTRVGDNLMLGGRVEDTNRRKKGEGICF